VKPTLKAVNKPLPHSIVHGLDKPGSSATVSIFHAEIEQISDTLFDHPVTEVR
jgi:hypothetical protein